MKELDQAIQEKREQLKILQAELSALENFKRRLSGQPDVVENTDKAKVSRRVSNLKGIILNLLKEVGKRGLNATSAVDMARKNGISLERASVSSLLSRLKGDGIVLHVGDVYVLKEIAHQESPSEEGIRPSSTFLDTLESPAGSASIFPHPLASKGR